MSTNGKIFGHDARGDFTCSGTVVPSGQEAIIVTAGHCVFDNGRWASSLVFVPAYDHGSEPFGAWPADDLMTTSQWANYSDEQYDVGFATIPRSISGDLLTDYTGSEGITFNASQSQTWSAFGYPAAAPFDGEQLFECNGTNLGSDPQVGPGTVSVACSMNEGSSGGGWIIGSGFVNSVNSYFYPSYPGIMFGPYFGSVAHALYQKALSFSSTTAEGDTTPPTISGLYASPNPFSPNGDGVKDSTKINWRISERSTVSTVIRSSSGVPVSSYSGRVAAGSWYDVWNGLNRSHRHVKSGTYTYSLRAIDAAGNASRTVSGRVVVRY